MAPRIDWNNPQEIIPQIKIHHDDFEKVTKYEGPPCSNPNCTSFWLDYLYVRAWKYDNNPSISYQIYVKDRYGDSWRYYEQAYDSDGLKMDTTLISREVSSCSQYGCAFDEHIGLNVTKEYLEFHKETGIRFKIIGTGGEEVFFIPGTYIKAFLEVVR